MYVYEVVLQKAGERYYPGSSKVREDGDLEFTATGLDAATRVMSRLNEVIRHELQADPEVGALVSGPYLRAVASPQELQACVMSEDRVVDNKISVRMPPELHQRLKVVAVRERKSVQEIINGLTEAYVQKKEAEASG